MALRLRFTLVYLLLAAIALGGFAVIVYLTASSRIYQNLDDGMTSRAQAITNVLATPTPAMSDQEITERRQALDQQAALGTVFEIRDETGRILYSSTSRAVRGQLPSLSAPTDSAPAFSTHKVQGSRLRFLTMPILSNGQRVATLEVAQPLSETDEALDQIRYVFIIGGLVVLVIASGSAYWLAGRALLPVRRASRLARDIERTADFSRRLPEGGPDDEMGELTTTLNAMISRVERMLLAQRAFLADSSHELRRPLTVLRTNIDVIKNPALSAEERTACLAEMSVEAAGMSRLLSDLLLLSREVPQAIEQGAVDYSALCQQAIEKLKAQDKQHELTSVVEPELRVSGDRERLAQMLWNVLENAAQYTPSGGRIDFRLERQNGCARIELHDTGVGIPGDDLPRVFERFYRGGPARVLRSDGVGLGLAIVKYVAEAHGGAVALFSLPGEGTQITIDVPAL
jgi:two-component system OmpR family sensor kinase